MKLTKRIIALTIVLCTLGAMMIPGVAAEDPSKDLVVNFSGANGDFTKLGLANGTTITAATINAAYEAGTIQWGLHATDTRGLQVKMASLWMMMRQYSNSTHSNVALSFKAPANGKYTLSIGYGAYAGTAKSDQVEAYVIPTPETALTNNSGTLRTTVAALRAEGAALITIPGTSATDTYDSGDKTVDLTGGQEYLLILAATGTSGADFRDYFTGFSLIWDSALEGEAPEATYDYSVSYNANYPDAEAIPADSLTSAEASVEFTAKTLAREGYTFEGWATSAESTEVEYAAGATITLTSESPSLNLYAVWTENSTEPEVSKDLVVNFSGADGDFTKLGLANGTTIAAATINAAYEAGTIKWGIHATDNRALQVKMASLWMMMRQYSNAAHSNVALSFKAPADGKYTLSIGYGQYDTKSDQVEAYVIPTPETALTNNNGTLRSTVGQLRAEGAALVTIPGDAATNTYDSGDKTVELTGGQEYLLILAATGTTGADYRDFFTGFSLLYQGPLDVIPEEPEASIEGTTTSGTLSDMLAAAEAGQTVVLSKDATINELNPTDGVILDLNGKTLTVTGAVDAEIKDTTDGDGILVAAQDAIITSPAGTIALWDNNASGYRVFNYELTNHAVSAGQDNVTGVDQKINFYSYAEENLAEDIESANWNALKLVTDTDNLKNIKADYVAGDINWRYEYASYVGQFATGKGNTLNPGDSSISFTMIKNSWVAIRFRSPNETGKMAVTLKTGNKASGGAIFDGYILKASDVYTGIDATTLAGYADNVAADPDVAIDAMYTAINNAITGAEPVFTNCEVATTGGNTYSESYNFEASTDYILVMKVQNAGASTQYVRITDLNITRQEKNGATQTFWSTLTFNKDYAYTLVSSGLSGLKFGFDMDWNGNQKTFDFSGVLADWANEELKDTSKKSIGLYVRVSGFEKLEETGTLTGNSYISSDKWEAPVYAEGSLTYTHN